MTLADLFDQPFGTLSDLVRAQADAHPDKIAVIDPSGAMTYRAFDLAIDRVAVALQRDGFRPGEVGAICATTSIPYALAFFGVLRAGGAVARQPVGHDPRLWRALAVP